MSILEQFKEEEIGRLESHQDNLWKSLEPARDALGAIARAGEVRGPALMALSLSPTQLWSLVVVAYTETTIRLYRLKQLERDQGNAE